MATADQIKALIKSFLSKDENRFFTIALQVADKEEKVGHLKFANELRQLVRSRTKAEDQVPSISRLRQIRTSVASDREPHIVEALLHLTHADTRLSDIVLGKSSLQHIERAILEYRQKDRLAKFALTPRRKLLLSGPPGTGKTLTAKLLATELGLPLYTLQLDGLISRYLGETAAKLRVVFNQISSSRAVYLFDEFDAIGSQRDKDNDVGEIRRVLNSFLQFFEDDASESIIVCATNHPELLDRALFRRFDDIIEFSKPGLDEAKRFVGNRLFMFDLGRVDLNILELVVDKFSYADLGQACDNAAKDCVLYGNGEMTTDALAAALERRAR